MEAGGVWRSAEEYRWSSDWKGAAAGCSPWQPEGCPSVPSMRRILLDEMSQSEPITVTVAKRKA